MLRFREWSWLYGFRLSLFLPPSLCLLGIVSQLSCIKARVRTQIVYLILALCLATASQVQASDHPRNIQLQTHLQRVLATRHNELNTKLDALLSVALNDRERAWLIYRWVTQHFKHDSRLAARIGNPQNHSLEVLYQLGGGSCAVYADVVHRLMARAGLDVKTIYGIAKGGTANTRRHGKPVNHVWNAVKIEGQWRIVDATWGAGYVDRHGFQRDQSDLFFLIPPEQAVLSHFDDSDELGQQARYGMNYRLFAGLPDDALYAASIGFDPKVIIETRSKRFSPALVSTFNQLPGTFRVLDAPVIGRLNRGPQKFRIESTVFEELMLLQGKTWTRLNKNGHVHFLTFKPSEGELIVMGRRPKQFDYEALLAYTVR